MDKKIRNVKRALLASLMAMACFFSTGVYAGIAVDDAWLDVEILGGALLVAETGEVDAIFMGSDAAYFSVLFLETPSDQGSTPIFSNLFSQAGSVRSLGTFEAGTELVFQLLVLNTWQQFYTGEASRNPDALAHAVAITTLTDEGYITEVGFEDLLGGGDKDYNDFMFALTNVIDPPGGGQVPEPGILLLFGLGLVGLSMSRSRGRSPV